MYTDLLKTEEAQTKRRDRELDLWQEILDQDPRLRLPVDMKWDLQRRERRRKAEQKAAKKQAAAIDSSRPPRLPSAMRSAGSKAKNGVRKA